MPSTGSPAPSGAASPVRVAFFVGLALVISGVFALVYALQPAGVFGSVVRGSFGGGAAQAGLAERVDAALRAMGRRSALLALGAIVAGIGARVLTRGARSAAPVAEDYAQAVWEERTLAAPRIVAGAGGTGALARPQVWPASAAAKTCPACGGRLISGGRHCAACSKTFP